MKEKREKKFSILPKSTGMAIAVLAAGFAEVVFLAFVLALDVLPFKFLAAIILLLLAIDAVILYLATSVSKRGTRRIGCLVIVFFMMITLLGGDYYIYSTNDTLNKISQKTDTWEYYYVLANVGSSYEGVDSIQGKTIFVADMDSKQLKEAKERIITKAGVEYATEADFVSAGEHLIDWEVKSKDIADAADAGSDQTASAGSDLSKTDADSASGANIEPREALVLLSESQYSILKSNIEGYKNHSKIVYKIKVKKRANDNSKAVNVTEDSFNVLISGIDSWGTIDKGGLSDVNMVMTVNPTTRTILLTSIPRDSYIPLHTYGARDKLTHTGIYGEEETKATIEDFLDIDINYTLRVNFSLLVDVINAIDGIDVYSDYEFESAITDWTYEKGWNHMSGKKALYFARERKAFLEGDMQRNKNQQKVLEATLKKITSSKVLLTRYTSILNSVEDEMRTDLTAGDLRKLAKMQLNDMRSWKIKKVNVTGSTGMAPCYSMGNQNLSCVFPTEESAEKARQSIHDVMYPASLNENKEQGNKKKDSKSTEKSTEN